MGESHQDLLDGFSLERRADLAAAVDEWDRTAGGCAAPLDLAATPLGLRAWAMQFADDATGILELRRGGRQQALLPVVMRTRRVGAVTLRHWASPGNFHWQFGYPLADEGAEGAIFALLGLLRRRREWDVLDVGPMLETSAHAQAMGQHGDRLGLRAEVMRRKPAPIVVAGQAWQEYYAGLSKNLRDKVGNGQRRLERLGEVALTEYTGGADLQARLRAFFELENSGWKGREGTSIAGDPKLEAFYTGLAQEAAASGQLRLYELRAGDSLVACDFCIAVGNEVQVLKIAYDEEHARASPGQVMRKHVLQRQFERGNGAIYDFRPGGGDHGGYKLRWANASRQSVVVRLFNPATARGRLAAALAGARRAWQWLRPGKPPA